MLQDLSYGLRMLRRSPGVSAVAALTLALGIGANIAMFSVLDAVLLRPLPYREPDRLVTLRAQIPNRNIYGAFVEYNTYGEWWRARARSFESMAAFTPGAVTVDFGGQPERVTRFRVSAGFLSMLGLRPAAGREFRPEEDRPGAAPVAMLSYGMWQRRFGADPGLIGRPILLDRAPATVVGILPSGFDLFGEDADLLVPLAASFARAPGMPSVGVHARLKPGVSLAAAQSEIDALCRGWVETYHYPNGWGTHVWSLHEYLVRDVRASLLVLAVAVALVLLIACANVANLLLARAGTRQREMAVRCALGAGTGRIIRQLLVESTLLAVIATALGTFAAWAGVHALAAGATWLPLQKTVGLDLRVLAFAVAAGLVTILLFGLAPALAAVPSRTAEGLREGGRAGHGPRAGRLRSALVVAEFALALLLAVGASLMARSLSRLQTVDPGFQPDGLLKATLTLPPQTYAQPGRRVAFFQALAERLSRLPGVSAAGMTSHLPFGGTKSGANVVVEGVAPPAEGEALIAFVRAADPGYFPALRVHLLRGRFFTPHDPGGSPVAIINQTMARKCWPGRDPVGKRFSDGRGPWITVVGVISDMRQDSLAEPPDLEWYQPLAQSPQATMALVVRTAGDPMQVAPAVRAAVRELDRELPLAAVGLVADGVAHSTRSRRFSAVLLGAFAGLALLLAAVGIYGVVSYSVAWRTHEIGVRMALGAGRGSILAMVVVGALRLGACGAALGVAGGLALTRLLRALLFGVSPTDPAIFTGACLLLVLMAAVAGYIPARRAARVEPITALREE